VKDLNVEDAVSTPAKIDVGLNIDRAKLKAACDGIWSRVRRNRDELGDFVQPRGGHLTATFLQVINGCSDLMVTLFGDAGVTLVSRSRHLAFA